MELVWLSEAQWREREAAHAARVDALTGDHLARRNAGERHPVLDFLFDYYGHSPGKLRRWHPGPDVVLEGAARTERAGWRGYGPPTEPQHHTEVVDRRPAPRDQSNVAAPRSAHRTDRVDRQPVPCDHAADGPLAGDLVLDAAGFVERRGAAIGFTRRLLTATLERPMQTGCFGLHEWAMVYRQPAERRHASWRLRLGADGTDAVVESHQLRCTHFDAFRFFTDEAVPRNQRPLSREAQVADEQPGCVHAGMDVYRWAFKLSPAVPSELVADAFALACELRELDMRASPYDLRDLGYAPIAIETPEGKREYRTLQRELGERANTMRRRLLEAIDALDAAASTTPVSAVNG